MPRVKRGKAHVAKRKRLYAKVKGYKWGRKNTLKLAKTAKEPPSLLRERVTSKGGTTLAALTSMQNAHMGELFQTALQAARQRAHELGDEFGA